MTKLENGGLSGENRAGLFARIFDYWTAAYRKVIITPYVVQTPKLKAGEMFKIAVVSDIHADTRFMPLSRIKEIVDTTNALGADLIHLGGDLSAQQNVTMTPLPLNQTISAVAKLDAPFGVISVTGNHDWWDDKCTQAPDGGAPACVEVLRQAGITVLCNSAMSLDHSSGLWVAGIDSQMAFERRAGPHVGADDIEQALQHVPSGALTILLAHEPDIFAELPDEVNVDLVLSGHTHGGQVRVFGARPVVPSKYGSRYVYGHHHENGRDLVVSAGLGCSKFPLRFGVLPEIVLVTLSGIA